MKIGDMVCTKRIGFPACGIIRTFFEPGKYEEYISKYYDLNENSFIVWDEAYPDWRTKRIVKVVFDNPIVAIRFDEYSKLRSDLSDEDKIIFYRYKMKIDTIYYPIDDLEVL